MPESFSGGGIKGDEVAFCVAGEYQAARGGENARPCGRRMLPFPFYFAGFGSMARSAPQKGSVSSFGKYALP